MCVERNKSIQKNLLQGNRNKKRQGLWGAECVANKKVISVDDLHGGVGAEGDLLGFGQQVAVVAPAALLDDRLEGGAELLLVLLLQPVGARAALQGAGDRRQLPQLLREALDQAVTRGRFRCVPAITQHFHQTFSPLRVSYSQCKDMQ